jgi:tripartite-type tricarboxylate transporter receptor subunit TctC
MQEAGVDNFDLNSWNGYFGPAGMDPQIVKTLNTAINKIVSDPKIKAQLAEMGFDAFSGTPEDFAQFVKDQYVLWGKWIKDANLAPQ